MDKNKYVVCPICNNQYRRIKTQHILSHNITLKQFNELFPKYEKICQELKKIKKEEDKKYITKNKDKIYKKNNEYKKKNKEKLKQQQKEYRLKNISSIKQKDKKYYLNNIEKKKEYDKKYIIKNYETIKEKKKFYRKSEHGKEVRKKWFLRTYDENKCKYAWRRLLKFYLRNNNQTKNNKTIILLGYDHIKFKQRIECQFTDGMSWKNYGDWHIDHKKPLSAFKKDVTPNIVNALCNLQPLWKTTKIINGKIYIGNLNKGSKFL